MYQNFNNPYYMQPAINPMQYNTQIQQPKVNTLPGKTVDSIDVVRAMDIPLDGSVSVFPLADGSAIVTKQLLTDGTSKTTIYKPVDNNENTTEYVTRNDFDKLSKAFDEFGVKDIKEDLKSLKKQIRDLKDDLKEKDD